MKLELKLKIDNSKPIYANQYTRFAQLKPLKRNTPSAPLYQTLNTKHPPPTTGLQIPYTKR